MTSKTAAESTTVIYVTYSNLPRHGIYPAAKSSLHHLEAVLTDWVTWHTRRFLAEAPVADICSGTLQFCPELAVPVGGGATALAFVDIPFKPQHVSLSCGFNVQYERVGGVPKYDYVSEMPLSANLGVTEAAEHGAQKSAATLPRRQSRRCFNCGSFLHSLKDCPETRDASAIAQARREKQQERLSLGNERYFTAAPEEFADLRPGVLSAELRMALGGLASADPPPWLHRMRALGYPPGYMTRPLNLSEHSGLVLLDDPADQQGDPLEAEHAETDPSSCRGQVEDTADPVQLQRVAIPGVNAPVPEGANLEKWSHRPSDLRAEMGPLSPRKRMRTEPLRQHSSIPLHYAPRYVLDVQAWPPQPHPGAHSASPGTWMQQGYLTSAPAYPGGQPGFLPYYAPSLQPGPMQHSQSLSPAMGYPEMSAAIPGNSGAPQYGEVQQPCGMGHYSGLHLHTVHPQGVSGYPQGGAYGLPSTPGTYVQQEMSPYTYGNGLVSPGLVSMSGGVSAPSMREQEMPPPPLPPELEFMDSSPPPPPPLDSRS